MNSAVDHQVRHQGILALVIFDLIHPQADQMSIDLPGQEDAADPPDEFLIFDFSIQRSDFCPAKLLFRCHPLKSSVFRDLPFGGETEEGWVRAPNSPSFRHPGKPAGRSC